MEDLLYYIGLGLIITFSLIRKAGKATARKGSKPANTPTTTPIPGFPPFEPMINSEHTPIDRPAPKITEEQESEAQSLETIFDEEEVYTQNRGYEDGRTTTNNIAEQTIATPKTPAKPQNRAEKAENSEILEDFDLRDAVIYSEILKPKFEE